GEWFGGLSGNGLALMSADGHGVHGRGTRARVPPRTTSASTHKDNREFHGQSLTRSPSNSSSSPRAARASRRPSRTSTAFIAVPESVGKIAVHGHSSAKRDVG